MDEDLINIIKHELLRSRGHTRDFEEHISHAVVVDEDGDQWTIDDPDEIEQLSDRCQLGEMSSLDVTWHFDPLVLCGTAYMIRDLARKILEPAYPRLPSA